MGQRDAARHASVDVIDMIHSANFAFLTAPLPPAFTLPLSHGTLGRAQGIAQAAVISGPFQVLIAGVPCSWPRTERAHSKKKTSAPGLKAKSAAGEGAATGW